MKYYTRMDQKREGRNVGFVAVFKNETVQRTLPKKAMPFEIGPKRIKQTRRTTRVCTGSESPVE